MALNFAPYAVFPVNPVNPWEDDLVPSFWIANGFSGGGVFDPYRSFGWGIEGSRSFGGNGFDDGGGSCGDSIAGDVLDLLPSDPFGMGMDLGATFTAIAGWLEDFEAESGLNFDWSRAMVVEPDKATNAGVAERFDSEDGGFDDALGVDSRDGEFVSAWDVDEFLSSSDEDGARVFSCRAEGSKCQGVSCSDGDGGAPHEALLFALGYLDVQSLLFAEMVCRPLRSAVRNDALLWRNIRIDQPLNERITDDDLLHLVRRAQGNLQSLSLVECPRITDNGLKLVLDCCPRLTKLSVPGCTRLSIEGLVNNLKSFRLPGMPGIKSLQIGGLYGITPQHFEELKFLLGVDKCQRPETRESQRFYHSSRSSFDNDCGIDIEMCPRCQNLRLVYDCPAESCQGKQTSGQQCRGCTFCIARCVQCGRCVSDGEYEETFCLDLLCSGCWKQLLQCQDKVQQGAKHTVSNKETRCPFCM